MSLPPVGPFTAGRWPGRTHSTVPKPLHVDVDAPPRSMSPGLQINYGSPRPISNDSDGLSGGQINKSYGSLGTREVHFNVDEDSRRQLPKYEQVSNLPTPTEPWARATFPSSDGLLPVESDLLVRLVPFGSHRVISEYRPVLAERLAEQNSPSKASYGRRTALNPVQSDEKSLPIDDGVPKAHNGLEGQELASDATRMENVPENGLPAHYIGSQTGQSYTYLRLLGTGAFLKVVLATGKTQSESKSSSLVAIKVFCIPPDQHDAYTLYIDREIGILRTLDHFGVLKMLDYNVNNELMQHLVLRYLPGGSMLEFLRLFYQNNHQLSWYWCFVEIMVRDLLLAVRYLHENNVVHRDIKLENILLNVDPGLAAHYYDEEKDYFNQEALWRSQYQSCKEEDRHGSGRSFITLIDFGLLKRLESSLEELLTRCGSLEYTLPELLMGLKYLGQATDAWLCGVVIYLLLENRLPFDPPPSLPMPEGRMVLPLLMKRQRQKNRTPHRIAMIDWAWFESVRTHEMTPRAQHLVLSLCLVVDKLLVRRQHRYTVDQALKMLEKEE